MKTKQKIETLTRLELTFNQARIYLALVQFGPATARELSKTSKITRQDIYRVAPTLQEVGIVEKLISAPTMFKAIPIEQGISILLKRKIAEQNELQKKTEELLRDLKNTQTKKGLQEEDSQFVMVPGIEAIIQRLREAAQKVQTSLDVVTSRQRFSPAILEFAEAYKKALERGVKIRIATERHVAEETALEIVRNLKKNPHFKVKYFSSSPEAIVSIFDNKEAMVTISSTAHLAGTSALWSNNTSFMALAQSYFESKWVTALDEDAQ